MAEFIELDDSNFDSTISKQHLALIDYYASWCGACRLAAPMFLRVAGDIGLPIYKVDAEKNPDARAHATIENLPTIALVRDGKVVASLTTSKEEGLREFLKENGAIK